TYGSTRYSIRAVPIKQRKIRAEREIVSRSALFVIESKHLTYSRSSSSSSSSSVSSTTFSSAIAQSSSSSGSVSCPVSVVGPSGSDSSHSVPRRASCSSLVSGSSEEPSTGG